MYSGIIQTATSKRLSLELDYRRPDESGIGVLCQEAASGGTECRDRADSQKIEFDRLLSLI
jgi:hypothetical protein